MSDNDLISRQDAIEAIRKSTEKYNYFMGMENYTEEDAIEAVKSVPTILSVSNTDKCTRLNCPMQASVVPPDCNNPDCPFRTDNNVELHLRAERAWQNYRKERGL